MTDSEVIIEVAKLDGWDVHHPNLITSSVIGFPPGSESIDDWKPLPNYLTSRDAIMPVIEKCKPIIGNNQDMFVSYLWREMGLKAGDCVFEAFLATPRQLCIALLKATGKWK